MFEGIKHWPVIADSVLAAKNVTSTSEIGDVVKIDPFMGVTVDVEGVWAGAATDNLNIKIIKSLDYDGTLMEDKSSLSVYDSVPKASSATRRLIFQVTGCVAFQIVVLAAGGTDTIVTTVRYRKYRRVQMS